MASRVFRRRTGDFCAFLDRDAVGLLPFAGGSQFAVEEFGGGAVGADPIAPAEQVVNFVGDLGSTGTPTF